MRKALVSFLLLTISIFVSAQIKTVVYFNSSESTLLPAARNTLDSLIPALKKGGKYHLRIDGYCDSTGSHAGNIILGKDRANSVFYYLKKHGISTDGMIRNGHAEANPSAPGNDAASKAKNRRVEIVADVSANNPSKFDASTAISDLQIGQQLVLKNLNFVNAEAILLPESVPTIKALLKYMLDHPTLEIKLNGHVCCVPDMDLSIARAKFVYDYLVRHDIAPARMSYSGYSNTIPLIPNDNTDSLAAKQNRRVEITIVKK